MQTRFSIDLYENQITQSLNLFHMHDNMAELPCNSTIRIMNSALDDNITPRCNLIRLYYKLICQMRNCCNHSLLKIVEFTNRLFKLRIIDDNMLRFILKLKELDVCFTYFTYITSEHIHTIMTSRLQYSYNNGHDELLINNMFNNVSQFNNDIVCELVTCTNSLMFDLLISNIDHTKNCVINEPKKFAFEIKGDIIKYDRYDFFFSHVCDALPYSIKLVLYLLDCGFELSECNILTLFDKIKGEQLMSIMEKTRIEITQNHFKKVMDSCIDRDIKINVLINNGYIPTMDDVLYGIKCSVEIPHIERFGIILGKNEYKECCSVGYFPRYEFIDVDDDLKNVVEACFSGKIQKVKNALKNGYKVDSEYMELLSNKNVIWPVYRELIRSGCKVTRKCIENQMPNYSSKQHKVSMEFFDNLFDEIDNLNKKCNKTDVKFKYTQKDVDKCKMISVVEHNYLRLLFGINNMTFIDIKIFIWSKKWIEGNHICVSSIFRTLFGLNNYDVVKIIDIDYLVCALFDEMGYL